MPMNCKKGDRYVCLGCSVALSMICRVLIPEFGGTPIKIKDEEYFMFSDIDILGKFC